MKKTGTLDLHPISETFLRSFDQFGHGIVVYDTQTKRLVNVNNTFERLTGYSTAELLNLPSFFALVTSDYQSVFQEWISPSSGFKLSPPRELTLLHKNGTHLFIDAAVGKLDDHMGSSRLLVIFRDKTPHKQIEEQLKLFQTITLAVNDARDFQMALSMVLRKVCLATGWEYGEAWIPGPDGTHLQLSPSSYGADTTMDRLRKSRQGITFRWGEGLPGRAWAERQPQWMEDVEADEEASDKTVILEYGLQTGMAIPAITESGVVAILVFFVSKKNQNKDLFIGVASVVAPQLGSLFQRKKAENERDRFFTVSPDLLCIAGFDGFFKQLNPAWEKTLGFSMKELKQKPFMEWIHPDDRDRTQKVIENLKDGGEVSDFENRYICKNGTFKWLMWSGSSYPQERLYFAVARDIGLRKTIEEESKRLNTFLDSIIENIPDMVFIKDAKDLKFVRFNRAGEELLGISRDKMIGKSDYDFFPREEADFFTTKDKVVLEDGQLVDIPQEPIHTKKGVRILHTKKIPILDEKGKPLYLLGISEDITDKLKK